MIVFDSRILFQTDTITNRFTHSIGQRESGRLDDGRKIHCCRYLAISIASTMLVHFYRKKMRLTATYFFYSLRIGDKSGKISVWDPIGNAVEIKDLPGRHSVSCIKALHSSPDTVAVGYIYCSRRCFRLSSLDDLYTRLLMLLC